MAKIKKILSYKGEKIAYYLVLRQQKYIRLKIENEQIIISAPLGAHDWEIEHLIYKNISKIMKIIELNKNHRNIQIEHPSFVKILGERKEVTFVNDKKLLDNNSFMLYETSEETIKKMYKKLAIQKYNYFLSRLHHWKTIMGLEFENFTLKEMKGKWGICYPSQSKIVLNIRLIHYPQIAIDYVVIHELSHLVHKNHSKDFWYLIEKYLPNYKSVSELLKVNVL